MTQVLTQIRKFGVVPVVTIEDPEDASKLADALLEGGLPCMEVAFRTAAAGEALRRIALCQPDLLLGAGTVLTVDQASEALDAGARFIFSPGFDAEIVAYCLKQNVPVFPGVCTTTDIQAALRSGLKVLKLFPVEPLGGTRYLKAVASPFPGIEFIPTGGVDEGNLACYLSVPIVVACGGSWIAPAESIAAKDFDGIRHRAAATVKVVKKVRKGSTHD